MITIDMIKKEIHFPPTSVENLAIYLRNYFPSEVWGEFKMMIDA